MSTVTRIPMELASWIQEFHNEINKSSSHMNTCTDGDICK